MSSNNNIELPEKPMQLQPQAAFLQYSSPLPPAELLHKYEKLGLLNKVVDLIELQASHRRQLENGQIALQNKQLDSYINHQKRRDWEAKLGQMYALIISIAGIFGGVYTAINGHPGAGSFISLVGLTGLAARFITGRDDKQTSRLNKKNRRSTKK